MRCRRISRLLPVGVCYRQNREPANTVSYFGLFPRTRYTAPALKTRFTEADTVFRDILKELRLRKNLTQAELAERLNVPQSYVSKFETGERSLDFVETNDVCKALGVTLTKFSAQFTAGLTKSPSRDTKSSR